MRYFFLFICSSILVFSCCEEDIYLGKLFLSENSKEFIPEIQNSVRYKFNDSKIITFNEIFILDSVIEAQANRISNCGIWNYPSEYFESDMKLIQYKSATSNSTLMISISSDVEFTDETSSYDTFVPVESLNIFDKMTIDFNSDYGDYFYVINLRDQQNEVERYPGKFDYMTDTIISGVMYEEVYVKQESSDTLLYSKSKGIISLSDANGNKFILSN